MVQFEGVSFEDLRTVLEDRIMEIGVIKAAADPVCRSILQELATRIEEARKVITIGWDPGGEPSGSAAVLYRVGPGGRFEVVQALSVEVSEAQRKLNRAEAKRARRRARNLRIARSRGAL